MFQAWGWVVTLVYFIHSLLIAQWGVKLEKINQVIWKVHGGTHWTLTSVRRASRLWRTLWFTTNWQHTALPWGCSRCKLAVFTAHGTASKSTVWRTPESVSPGQLWESKHRFPGFSWDKPNRLSQLEPQNPSVKQIHQRACMHLKHKNGVRGQRRQ